MSARRLAALCSVLICGLSTGRAEPVSSPDRRVVVYLQKGLSPEIDRTVSYMRRELETLMQTAGYRVEWKVLGNPSGDEGESVIAVVELRGSCRAPEAKVHVKPVENGASLASTAVDGDQVLPFTWINCGILTQLLAPRLAGVESGRRDFLYGRAMGRLLAHELYHLLANKREHTGSGVGKSSFSASDVLGEHFTFEDSALARLNVPDSSDFTEAESAEEPAAGR
jgi:hypothetical protein